MQKQLQICFIVECRISSFERSKELVASSTTLDVTEYVAGTSSPAAPLYNRNESHLLSCPGLGVKEEIG